MNSRADTNGVDATKEKSIVTETARSVRGQQQTAANGEHPLRTSKCTIRFGGLVAVNELYMAVREGEI